VPRAMWSGAISFGLVNIPVKLYKATAPASGREISFHQIHKTCGARLRHIRWCPRDEVEVPWDDVAKGYEVAKGKYVEVANAELAGLDVLRKSVAATKSAPRRRAHAAKRSRARRG
jgi:DNA end-binding protein Ku